MKFYRHSFLEPSKIQRCLPESPFSIAVVGAGLVFPWVLQLHGVTMRVLEREPTPAFRVPDLASRASESRFWAICTAQLIGELHKITHDTVVFERPPTVPSPISEGRTRAGWFRSHRRLI